MKKLVLFIFLVLMWCNVAFAKIGDVYYCEMNKIVKTEDTKVVEFTNQKFKFKREKNILKFGSDGFFNNYEMVILKNNGEYFWGGGEYSRMIYLKDKFVFSNLLNISKDKDSENPVHRIYSIVATCEIF